LGSGAGVGFDAVGLLGAVHHLDVFVAVDLTSRQHERRIDALRVREGDRRSVARPAFACISRRGQPGAVGRRCRLPASSRAGGVNWSDSAA
jgi:hypothetical protein